MTGDGAIPGSPKLQNFTGRTVKNLCSGHKAASSTVAMLQAGASPGQCADKAPTPFFDLLTTMIEAHAAESGRALRDAGATDRIGALVADITDAKAARRTNASAAPPAASHRRRAQHLNVCVVGLIMAMGNVIYVSEAGNKVPEVGKEQPPVIAADAALQARSVVIGNAVANDKAVEPQLPAGEPGSSPTIGVGEERIDEGEIGTKSSPDAPSDDQAVATPVVEQPTERPGSDMETQVDGAAGERIPGEAVRPDPIAPATNASAEEPPRPDASSPPPPARGSRSAIERANEPVATQVGRTISGVNMRAGPSNGQPVLATIPRGSPIEVVKCGQWCEVIFAGQRGWVYKTFIRAPLADVAMSPVRARPSPRKAGSNSAVWRGNRTWGSDPHRFKPVKVRVSTDQSTRDGRSASHSSSGNFFWSTVEYLWNQIRPPALRRNYD